MKNKRLVCVALSSVMAISIVLFGCGGATTEQVLAHVAPAEPEAQPQQNLRAPAPPYRFSPSSHSPIYRAQSAPPVDPGQLPRFVLRMQECFGRQAGGANLTRTLGKGNASGGFGGGAQGAGSSGSQVSSPGTLSSGRPSKAKRSADDGGSRMSSKTSSARASELEAPRGEAGFAPSSPLAVPSEAAPEMSRDYEEQKPSPDQRIAGNDAAPTPAYDDWGAAIYLSNDDTMSLSSAQRVLYAIDHFLPLPIEHIRPHELLNYFSFDTAPVVDGFDFSVVGGLAPDPAQNNTVSLALAIRGRPVDLQSRRNAALTVVVDRSGSMGDEGRMDYLRRGLSTMLTQLKSGDIVNMVVFDDEVCVPVQGFVVGRDSLPDLARVIEALAPRGSTDLHRGLTRGYELADATYQPSFTNRVLLITDALANTGVTDDELIATVSRYYDRRRIRLSGVGVGREFNDALLDRLTERGKGAYLFLGSSAEVDAVFGSHFLSLIETTANDVRFRLHLPPSLRMQVFYGEESSTVAADVQEIHYFANTSQLFLSDLMFRGERLRPDDEVMLSIEYRDPETDMPLVEQTAMRLGDLEQQPRNVAKARLIMSWIDMVAMMANDNAATTRYERPGGWVDPAAFERCEQGTKRLRELSSGIDRDPEVLRVLELWERFCARYERPRQPVRRQIAAPPQAWPGATETQR